jgi:hypothetical protein
LLLVFFLIISLVLFPTMLYQELHERGKDKWYFGWSYGVAWGGGIFLFGAGLLLLCDRNKEEIHYTERLYLNHEEDDQYESNSIDMNQESKIKTLTRN